MKITSFYLFTALASAAELHCFGSQPNIGFPAIEWAIKNRATDLGVPGGTKYEWQRAGQCCYKGICHDHVILRTVRFTKERGYVPLAGSDNTHVTGKFIECEKEPKSIC